MKNDFLEFYGSKNISPVKQNISDISTHYKRREKLYRQLGIPVITFCDADVLEVGPGSGYNTLAFFHWGSKFIDLVEANPKGIEDIDELFTSQSIPKYKYSVFNSVIENYHSKKKYDIIIAESFLQFLDNQKEIIDKMKELIHNGGVIVITCSDETCFFIEQMKRLVGQALVKDFDLYNDKVSYLAKVFEPQLKTLRGVSRCPEDWVQDQLLNPAGINGNSLSISDAINYFGEDFEVLGGSPNLFTDYSWYKDIWYDYKRDYLEQFERKNCNLLMANMKEKFLEPEENRFLKRKIKYIKMLAVEYEKSYDSALLSDIQHCIEDIMHLFNRIDEKLFFISKEIILILDNIVCGKQIDFDKTSNFFYAFGRTQQYLSMVKKFE